MKKWKRLLVSLLTVSMTLGASTMSVMADDTTPYTYKVTLSAGNKGTINGQNKIEQANIAPDSTVTFNLNDIQVTDDKYYVKGIRLSGRDNNETLAAPSFTVDKDADYVVFFGGLNKSNHQDCEDSDRASLGLPYAQDRVIGELAKVNKNLIVVNISGNAVAMPWVNEVPAIVQGWFLGSEAGTALASVLVGDANPSGKLPFTFPAKLEDVGAHKLGEYPGNKEELAQSKHRGDTINEIYREDIFVGYRWADKEKIKPLFPFGHGLSYTTFAYGKPSADKKTMTADDTISFTVNVKNTGTREGQEVVQLYISDKKSSLPRPVKELKGFQKVKLAPGEEKAVTLTIDKKALSFFDDAKHEWVAEPGKFEAIIGSSSRDIKGIVPFELK